MSLRRLSVWWVLWGFHYITVFSSHSLNAFLPWLLRALRLKGLQGLEGLILYSWLLHRVIRLERVFGRVSVGLRIHWFSLKGLLLLSLSWPGFSLALKKLNRNKTYPWDLAWARELPVQGVLLLVLLRKEATRLLEDEVRLVLHHLFKPVLLSLCHPVLKLVNEL